MLGYRLDNPPPPYASWDEALDAWGVPEERRNDASASVDAAGVGPRLFFQRVPEGKSAKNRLHLDVRAAPGLRGEERMAALERRCDELLALGASRLYRVEADGIDQGHITMADPEGNEFCLD